jgi:uncharacterized protein
MVRHVSRTILAGLALAGLTCLLLGPVGAQVKTGGSETKIKVKATAEKPDAAGKQVVTLTIDVEKGWHIYANPVGNEDLDATKTIITFTSKGKPVTATVNYPPGKLVLDKTVGNYKVYEDRVAIQATVERPDVTAPLEATIKLNACNDRGCLPPGQTTITVP